MKYFCNIVKTFCTTIWNASVQTLFLNLISRRFRNPDTKIANHFLHKKTLRRNDMNKKFFAPTHFELKIECSFAICRKFHVNESKEISTFFSKIFFSSSEKLIFEQEILIFFNTFKFQFILFNCNYFFCKFRSYERLKLKGTLVTIPAKSLSNLKKFFSCNEK